MAKCQNCETIVKQDHKFCPSCGEKMKKAESQPTVGGEKKKIENLQARIEYLEGELKEAGIEFEQAEDDD